MRPAKNSPEAVKDVFLMNSRRLDVFFIAYLINRLKRLAMIPGRGQINRFCPLSTPDRATLEDISLATVARFKIMKIGTVRSSDNVLVMSRMERE